MAERRKDSKNRVLKDGEYERSNGTFEYKWRDQSGKRHSVYAKTLKELREKELDVLRDIMDGIKVDNKKQTINDVYHLWLNLKRGLKGNTLRNYQYMYEQYVMPDFGRKKIADLKRSDVRSFYNRLVDVSHLRTSTIDCVHTVLHQVLQVAVDDDYIRYNPSDRALTELRKSHCADSVKRKALTLKQQELFESFLKLPGEYNKWYPIFTAMLWTGLRAGEITGLRWCDVDFDAMTISINHTLVYYDKGDKKGMKYAINTPKTEAGIRTIPMLPIVRDAILMEKDNHEAFGIQCDMVIDGYTDFIFLNRFGKVYNYTTLNKALRRIIRDCNYDILDKSNGEDECVLLPHFSNHYLRHTFTTRMVEAGVNVKAMQDILGHADSETTMDVYAEATPEFKRAELINFAEYFNKRKIAEA